MQPAPRKTGSTWKTAGVVLAVVMVALGVLSALAGVGLWRGWPARLADGERETLVVAAELAPLYDFVLQSDAETFSKTRFFDGRTALAYRYEHPDPAAPFRLTSRVIFAPDRVAARDLYVQHADQLDAAGQADGFTFEERNQAFAWGDAWRYGVLRDGETMVGHALACRRGAKVFFLELSGVGLDEARFGELVLPSLQTLESYSP